MKRNFLYQITAASRTPDYGATAPQIPFSLSSTDFVEPKPPPRTKFLGMPLIEITHVGVIKIPMKFINFPLQGLKVM